MISPPPLRPRGIQVINDGLHATCVPDEAQDQADSVITGECENIWNALLTGDRNHALELFRAIEPPVLKWEGKTTIKIADDPEQLEAASTAPPPPSRSRSRFLARGSTNNPNPRCGCCLTTEQITTTHMQSISPNTCPRQNWKTALTCSTNGSFSLGAWRRGCGVKLATSGYRPH